MPTTASTATAAGARNHHISASQERWTPARAAREAARGARLVLPRAASGAGATLWGSMPRPRSLGGQPGTDHHLFDLSARLDGHLSWSDLLEEQLLHVLPHGLADRSDL